MALKYQVNKFQKIIELSCFLGQKGFKHATDSGYYGRGAYFSVNTCTRNFTYENCILFPKLGISWLFNELYKRLYQIVIMSNPTRKSKKQRYNFM
jgi:hypothetical protein